MPILMLAISSPVGWAIAGSFLAFGIMGTFFCWIDTWLIMVILLHLVLFKRKAPGLIQGVSSRAAPFGEHVSAQI